MELSVSRDVMTGLVAVGWCEPGEALPRDVRVVEPELAELLARAVAARVAHPSVGDTLDLDRLLVHVAAVLAARQVDAPDASDTSDTPDRV